MAYTFRSHKNYRKGYPVMVFVNPLDILLAVTAALKGDVKQFCVNTEVLKK